MEASHEVNKQDILLASAEHWMQRAEDAQRALDFAHKRLRVIHDELDRTGDIQLTLIEPVI